MAKPLGQSGRAQSIQRKHAAPATPFFSRTQPPTTRTPSPTRTPPHLNPTAAHQPPASLQSPQHRLHRRASLPHRRARLRPRRPAAQLLRRRPAAWQPRPLDRTAVGAQAARGHLRGRPLRRRPATRGPSLHARRTTGSPLLPGPRRQRVGPGLYRQRFALRALRPSPEDGGRKAKGRHLPGRQLRLAGVVGGGSGHLRGCKGRRKGV